MAGTEAVRVRVVERSAAAVERDCRAWAREVAKTFVPDLVVFIAKSGFLFARPMVDEFGCTVADIVAARPDSGGKDRLGKVKDLIPKPLVKALLASPMNYKRNASATARRIEPTGRLLTEVGKHHERILVVDDSVDTGHTMSQVMEKVRELFPGADARSASYILVDYARDTFVPDFYLYKNLIVMTATGRTSPEYEKFLSDYEAWKKASENRE